MVNPIASAASVPINPLPADIERPVIFPEPAQQVTAAGETLDAQISQDKQQQSSSDSIQLPLDKALEELNNSMQAWSTGMRFNLDPEAQRVVVSIVDNATGEVLRTVPSDAVIRVAKMIVQLQGKAISTQA